MPVNFTAEDRRFERVDAIEIRIGDECVKHNFGRKVPMSYARKWAQHYLDVFTGEKVDG